MDLVSFLLFLQIELAAHQLATGGLRRSSRRAHRCHLLLDEAGKPLRVAQPFPWLRYKARGSAAVASLDSLAPPPPLHPHSTARCRGHRAISGQAASATMFASLLRPRPAHSRRAIPSGAPAPPSSLSLVTERHRKPPPSPTHLR